MCDRFSSKLMFGNHDVPIDATTENGCDDDIVERAAEEDVGEDLTFLQGNEMEELSVDVSSNTKRDDLNDANHTSTGDVVPEASSSGSPNKAAAPTQHTRQLHLRVKFCNDPFHLNVSTLQSFYEEIEIEPMQEAYWKGGRNTQQRTPEAALDPFRVKLGDAVTIEYDHGTRALISKKQKKNKNAHYPFAFPWCPAEVVAIYKNHKSREYCLGLHTRLEKKKNQGNGGLTGHIVAEKNLLQLKDCGTGRVTIEIQRFYRPHEIPGSVASKARDPATSGNGEVLDEVFESDQISECSADSILVSSVLSLCLTIYFVFLVSCLFSPHFPFMCGCIIMNIKSLAKLHYDESKPPDAPNMIAGIQEFHASTTTAVLYGRSTKKHLLRVGCYATVYHEVRCTLNTKMFWTSCHLHHLLSSRGRNNNSQYHGRQHFKLSFKIFHWHKLQKMPTNVNGHFHAVSKGTLGFTTS